MKRISLLLFAMLLWGVIAHAGFSVDLGENIAQENLLETKKKAYTNFFIAPQNELESYFSQEFLQHLNLSKIIAIRENYENTLGKFIEALEEKTAFKLIFANGDAHSAIGLDEQNKISSVWFGPPNLSSDSFDNIADELRQMPGKVALCILKHDNNNNEEEIFTLNHTEPLGCGSAFKLYLLKALEDAVAKGEWKMSDTIALTEDSFSFPSGMLQEWPTNSRHTLETLAGLMISVSDNTATDHIYNLLGKTRLRGYFPKTCTELLNTAQLIKFKFLYKELAEEYANADQKRKDAILQEINSKKAKDVTLPIQMQTPPFLINEIEWFISPLDLCRVIYSLRDNKLLRINPAHGIAKKSDWHIIGYKGGSEPGVLNFTWILQKTPESHFYSLSCTTINPDADIDMGKLSALSIRLLKLISDLP